MKPIESKAFHLLIAAAGQSSRMGNSEDSLPKPYLKINGKAVLRHTIEKFLPLTGLKSITVIINPEHVQHYNDAVHELKMNPYIDGSTSRKRSIYNGLISFTEPSHDETILIHDAARPCVKTQDIVTLLNVISDKNVDGATLATSVSDTLHHDNKTIDRDELNAIQTPQAFKLSAIIDAHQKFEGDDNFTDDVNLIRAMGKKVELVHSSRENIKITTQEDLIMAEKLLSAPLKTRTAMGSDVHAFATEKTEKPLILGGITIPHSKSLTGHSDADVVLHAITDALLGSINAGDIGTHFPPSDNQWKDADSSIFLESAAKMLAEQSANIDFIDITIISEAPKIGPHREKMQQRISDILSVSADIISIKATTTEKLGFTGREEGIACQAVATISLPA